MTDTDRVIEAVDAYLAELRAGRAPDREAFLCKHSDLADQIRECLPALEFIEKGGDHGAQGEGLGGTLGDFRIVREIGRGGMGVVYEAEQISLRRRVALKALPFAAVLDPKQLQRFRNEAQAAAQLHHTNIVPVYSVGCERGVHYYAMQYIEGESLARAIRDLRGEEKALALTPISSHTSHREPAFVRMAARIGMQAAEALDHAHQLGVVHRDVKPGNLLVDATGSVWVADFGLARFEHSDNLTRTGDLVGTMRYMSPEQALGKRVPIDHRTDVYSLGATLYELFTLEPAVQGEDPQAVIQEIAFRDPKPPKKLNPSLPADLEKILLKAMAKDPVHRYASAQEMADDLRRFLEDKPVVARRPSITQRAARWARRHRAAVAAGAGVLMVAVIALAASTWLIAKEQRQTQGHLERERRHAARAEASFRSAMEAVDRLLTRVAESELDGIPHADSVRRALLEDALGFYARFLAEKGDDPAVRTEAAIARVKTGCICHELGEYRRAEQELRTGVAELEQLGCATPDARASAAAAQGRLAALLCDTGRAALATELFDGAITTLRRLVDDFPAEPGYALDLGRMLVNRSAGTQLDTPAVSEAMTREAIAVLSSVAPALQTVELRHACALARANAVGNLGANLANTGRIKEAEALFREESDAKSRLLKESPQDARVRSSLAAALCNLAKTIEDGGSAKEAEAVYREGLATWTRLASEFPERPRYRVGLANCRAGLARLLRRIGRLREADDLLRQALEALPRIEPGSTGLPAVRASVGRTMTVLGSVLRAAGRPKDAEAVVRGALAIQASLLAEYPDAPDSEWLFGQMNTELARVLRQAGRASEAELSFREAIAIFTKLATAYPHRPAHRESQADASADLARLLDDADRLGEAEDACRAAIDTLSGLLSESPEREALRGMLGQAYRDLSGVLQRAGRVSEAEDAGREALSILGTFVDLPGPAPRSALSKAHALLGMVRTSTGRFEEAESAYTEALNLATAVAHDFPDWPEHRRTLAVAEHDLGALLERTGRPAEAEGAYRRALSVLVGLSADCPEVPDYRRLLASMREGMGRALTRLGRIEEAETFYVDALATHADLAAEFPEEPIYRSGLARARLNLAAALSKHAHRWDDVERHLREALSLYSVLASHSPDLLEYQSALGHTHLCLGLALRTMARRREAEESLRAAMKIFADMASSSPGVPHYALLLTRSRTELAVTLRELGNTGEAIELLRETLRIHVELAAALPGVPGPRVELGHLYQQLGETHAAVEDWQEAERAYEQALRIREELVKSHPDESDHVRVLAGTYGSISDALRAAGRWAEAESLLRKGAALLEGLVKRCPGVPDYRHHLAASWDGLARALLSSPHRSEATILEAAQRAAGAIELEPDEPAFWNTLGVARHHAADWRGAIEALGRSIELSRGGTSHDFFHLAMAYWRIGEKDKAREWNDRGVTWAREHQPEGVELARLRAEVAQLLGVP